MILELQKTAHERAPQAPVRPGTTLARNINGTVVTLTALDVSRSYLGTGLHANAIMSGGGGLICLLDPGCNLATATRQSMESLLDTVALCACSECGKPAFDPSVHTTTNRGGLCERCFLGKGSDRLKTELAVESDRVAVMDAAMKNRGNTHRIDAWIHMRNGEDRQVSFYMHQPSNNDIKKEMQVQGSLNLNDFRKVAL